MSAYMHTQPCIPDSEVNEAKLVAQKMTDILQERAGTIVQLCVYIHIMCVCVCVCILCVYFVCVCMLEKAISMVLVGQYIVLWVKYASKLLLCRQMEDETL